MAKTTKLDKNTTTINIAQPKLVVPNTENNLPEKLTASEQSIPATRAVPETPQPTHGLKKKGIKVENLKLFLETKRLERAKGAAGAKYP